MKIDIGTGSSASVLAEYESMDDYYSHLDQVFSDASRIYDDKILSNFVNVNIRNTEMKILHRYSRDSANALEIGCGTGEESKKFIQETGKKLQCIDIASGMVSFSTEKMKNAGLSDKFTATRLRASSLKTLGKKFDVVYSFNGAFNTEPDTSSLLDSLCHSMTKGSILIFSLRNRKCLGESIAYAMKRRTSELRKRRAGIVEVEVVGETIRSRYYSKEDVLSLFSHDFKLLAVYGLGIVIPPYMAEKVRSGMLKALITKIDRLLCRIPVFRMLGDETAYVMERK